MSTSQAIQAQQIHEPTLMKQANVVGVAVGFKASKGDTTGDVAVVVLVQQKKPLAALSAEDVIPPELEGMRTDVYEVGYLRAQQAQIDPKVRMRPVISAGVSIGQYKVTAGTLGVMVTDKATGARLILSNNHVLANSNDATVGDAILQPGAIDGGQNPGDMVAKLERFVALTYTDDVVVTPPPIPPTPDPNPPPPTGNANTGCLMIVTSLVNALASILGSQQRVTTTTGASAASVIATAPAPVAPTVAQAAVPTNQVDCALGRPIDPAMFSDQILQIGVVSGTKAASLGQRVRKYGRTSQYTEGNITLLNATVNIAYNTMAGQKTARFTGQVITESMSQGGDSGSLIVDATENKAVGLLFAGSELATIFTPIDYVLTALNVTI